MFNLGSAVTMRNFIFKFLFKGGGGVETINVILIYTSVYRFLYSLGGKVYNLFCNEMWKYL